MRLGKNVPALGLLISLAFTLSACPEVVSWGAVFIEVEATDTTRCDDGIKVVVEGIQEDWGLNGPLYEEHIRDKGPNWVWVEPGHWGGIRWDVFVNAQASRNPQGKEITVKAYCMRTGGTEPGLSQRKFALADYIVQRGKNNLLELTIQVYDSESDPDYTVTPPGLTIENHQQTGYLARGKFSPLAVFAGGYDAYKKKTGQRNGITQPQRHLVLRQPHHLGALADVQPGHEQHRGTGRTGNRAIPR